MFDNIGSKIKALAFVLTIIGIIASVILGFINLPAGIFIIPIGCLLSWVSSMLIYGFGQLIENTDKLVNKLAPGESSVEEISVSKTVTKRENWTCVSCGTENMGRVPYCNGCGVNREWSMSKSNKNEN